MHTAENNAHDVNEETLSFHAALEAAKEQTLADQKLRDEQAVLEVASKEWQATADKARAARLMKLLPHYTEIAKRLKVLSVPDEEVVFDEKENTLVFGGIDLRYWIEFKDERTADTWRPKPTGRLRMAIGSYGDTTSFPQRKDGTFNYQEAAIKLAAKARNEAYSYAFSPSASLDKPISIRLNTSFEGTPEEVKALIAALAPFGIKIG